MLEAGAYVLAHVVVAELITEFGIEFKFFAYLRLAFEAVGPIHRMVVCKFVGIYSIGTGSGMQK